MARDDVQARFLARLAKLGPLEPGACWPWPGKKTSAGYGQMRRHYAFVYTHRVSYEIAKGPIPAGRVIDHICRNKSCCNPAHLEAVTPRENYLRGADPRAQAHNMGTCTFGHPIAGDNVLIGVNGEGVGRPRCRRCMTDLNRKYAEQRRARRAEIL